MNERGIAIVFIALLFAGVLQSFQGISMQESVASLIATPIYALGFLATNLMSVPGIIVLILLLYSTRWLFAGLGLENILGFIAVLFLLFLIL